MDFSNDKFDFSNQDHQKRVKWTPLPYHKYEIGVKHGDPQGRPTSDHCFHTRCPYVRPHFSKSREQSNFQV